MFYFSKYIIKILTATKKCRPNNSNNLIINDLNVEYLSTKSDKFYNAILYLKLLDQQNKLKLILDTQTNDKDTTLPVYG